MKISRDSILTLSLFFVLTVVFYALGYWLIFRMGKATPLMLSVGFAAVFTCLLRKRDLTSLGWSWGPWKYQWLSYLLPLALITTSCLVIWLANFGGWYNAGFVAELRADYSLPEWNDASLICLHFFITATMSFCIALPSIIGEEIAWRGLLVSELSKFMSFTGVALVSGFFWAIWHWHLIVEGLYGNNVTPLPFQLFVFTLLIMSYAMVMTYLRYKTNFLWSAVLFHASSNTFLQKFYTPLTTVDAASVWYIDEFGVVLPIVAFAAAFYFWKKGKDEFGVGSPGQIDRQLSAVGRAGAA